jgi:hypothetical protein
LPQIAQIYTDLFIDSAFCRFWFATEAQKRRKENVFFLCYFRASVAINICEANKNNLCKSVQSVAKLNCEAVSVATKKEARIKIQAV